MKIFLNAGHCVGIDSGAINKNHGVTEAEIVRDIALLLEYKLENEGFEVVTMQSNNLCGEDGQDFDDSIVNHANYEHPNAIISLHCNAFNEVASGTETYYGSYKAMKLAEAVQDKLVSTLGTRNRGTKDGLHLAIIKWTDAPAILVELAFIDNDNDCEILLSRQDEIAEAILQGIKAWAFGG